MTRTDEQIQAEAASCAARNLQYRGASHTDTDSVILAEAIEQGLYDPAGVYGVPAIKAVSMIRHRMVAALGGRMSAYMRRCRAENERRRLMILATDRLM